MKNLLVLLLFIAPFFSISQTKGDIGFIYNTFSLNRINLDYRKPIGEKYKFKIGAVIGTNSSTFNEPKNIVFGSDSLITFQDNVFSANQFSLKIGAERKLGESMFSIGTDLLFSYRDEKKWIYEYNYLHNDSLNNWQLQTANNSNGYGFNNTTNSKVRRGYFVPQLQFYLSMDIPVVSNLYLNLFVGGVFSFPIFINESQKNDPFNDYPIPTNVNTFEMSNQAGIGLRYAL